MLSLSSDNRSLAQVGIKPNGSTHLVGKGVAIALSLLHCYACIYCVFLLSDITGFLSRQFGKLREIVPVCGQIHEIWSGHSSICFLFSQSKEN